MRVLYLLFSLCLLVFARTPDKGSCYFPDGNYTSNHHPCDLYAFGSLCCPTGWTCFSNRLCIITSAFIATRNHPIGTTIRGTCTDPSWNSSACGDFCLNGDKSGALTPCGDGRWCCSSDKASGNCDCRSGDGTFAIPSGQPQAVVATIDGLYTVLTGSAIPTSTGPVVQPSRIITTLSASASSSSPTSSSISTSTIPSTSSPPSFSTELLPTTITLSQTATITLSPTASPTPPSPQPTSPSPQSDPKTIGLATSCSVIAAILLVTLLMYLRRLYRDRRTPPAPDPDTYMGPNRHSDPLLSGLVGPPAPPGPVPHPYHTRGDANAGMGSIAEEGPQRGLSQIRQDMSGQPLFNPYAAAARRADSGQGAGGLGSGAGRSTRRGTRRTRRPVGEAGAGAGAAMERAGGVRMERGEWVEETGGQV